MSSRTPFALAMLVATSAWGQSVISAHSGVIHLAEGQVDVDGTAVHQKFGEFGDVKTDQTLATQDGRAEVLLTPGVFLRVGENSSFKMISNKLTDTRIEGLSGTLMVQVDELLQDNVISLKYRDANISLTKKGIYRLDAASGSEPARLRVFEGEATVAKGDQTPVTARKGREVELAGEKLEARNFDTKETDAFYRWNERRDEYISEANVSAAKSARDAGMGFANSSSGNYGSFGGYGGYGSAGGLGTWAFNPWYGMYTYLPYDGMYYSPFGFGYYSPGMVGYLYGPNSPYLLNGTNSSLAGVTRNSPIIASGARPTTTASTGVFGNRGGSVASSEARGLGTSGSNLGGGSSSPGTSGGGLAGTAGGARGGHR
jgi:hypothetical protein